MKLNQAIPNWMVNGIFHYIQLAAGSAITFPSPEIDMQYHGNRSGGKEVSPLVDSLLSDSTLSAQDCAALGSIIWKLYGQQWQKLYATLSLQYNPISNYDMTEHRELNGTNTGTVTDNSSGSSSGTGSATGSSNSAHNLYGFNATTTAAKDSEDTAGSTSSTTTSSETENDNTRTDNLANTEEYTLTRSGNIGVTTSQQMIQSERDLWMWNFYDHVFSDVDKVLVIQCY